MGTSVENQTNTYLSYRTPYTSQAGTFSADWRKRAGCWYLDIEANVRVNDQRSEKVRLLASWKLHPDPMSPAVHPYGAGDQLRVEPWDYGKDLPKKLALVLSNMPEAMWTPPGA